MIINELELAPFAGISKKDDLKFDGGLNVLFGPNEAGKSTVVEAILSLFFLSIRPHKGSEDDKLLKRLYPHPQGDTIKVSVSFTHNGERYQLKCIWGKNPSIELTLPNGNLITNEDSVRSKLDEILAYGYGTYKNILIARQADMAKTIEALKTNPEATNSLAEALRKTLMEADGVSVEKLKDRIESEIEDLLSRWDIERKCPEGNRGIDNPWQKEVGEVLKAYYEVEERRKDLTEARGAEEENSKKAIEFRETEEQLSSLSDEVRKLKALSGDIQRRKELEPELKLLRIEEEELKEANKEWPIAEKEIEKREERLKEVKEAKGKLESELEIAKEAVKSREVRKLYEQVEPIHRRIEELKEQINRIPEIRREDLQEFKSLEDEIAQHKAAHSAGKLLGKFISRNSMKLSVQKDFEKPELISLEPDKEVLFDAGGQLIIESEQDWRLEVRSGEQDIEEIKKRHDEALKELEEKKSELSVTSVPEVEERVKKREGLERKMGEENRGLEVLLNDRSFDDLKEAVDNLGKEKITREPDNIRKDLDELNPKQSKYEMEIKEFKDKIEKWRGKYEEHDKVFERLGEVSAKKKQIEKEFDKLASLPEGYESAEACQNDCLEKEQTLEKLKEKHTNLRVELTIIENNVSENTTEEIEARLKEIEEKLEGFKKRAQAVLRVKKEFEKVVEEMDSETFKPLVSSFVGYLAPLTASRYKSSSMDGALPSGIMKDSGGKMPLNLLSTGTRDGMALALRLAMSEYLLQNRQGFMIMDDPLVNLDPERKKAAAKVLKEFAQKFQLIITTCDPNTAKLLGGNQIKISNL